MRAIMEGRTQMRDVKVKVSVLLEKVKTNREKHIEEYEEAVDGYKDAARVEIRRVMAYLENRIDELDVGEMIHLAAVRFDLDVPFNHEKDYDQVITMLEMSVDKEVTVKADEFACYVMDDWSWKKDFLAVHANYSKK